MPEQDELETWKNVTKGRIVVQRLGAAGQRRVEILTSGRVVHLSPQERRINQELAATDQLDIFQNGALQPVRLGTSDEAVALAANPNHLKDEEAVALFGSHWKTFEKRVNQISNVSAIERLIELSGSTDVDATVRQVEFLRARLLELQPTDVEERQPIDAGAASIGPKAVSPR